MSWQHFPFFTQLRKMTKKRNSLIKNYLLLCFNCILLHFPRSFVEFPKQFTQSKAWWNLRKLKKNTPNDQINGSFSTEVEPEATTTTAKRRTKKRVTEWSYMNKRWIVKMLIKLQSYDRGGHKTPTERHNHFFSSFLKWMNFNEKTENVNFCSAIDAYDISCCDAMTKIHFTNSINRCQRCTWFCGCIHCLTCWLIALPLSLVVLNNTLKLTTNVTNSSIRLHILNRNAAE